MIKDNLIHHHLRKRFPYSISFCIFLSYYSCFNFLIILFIIIFSLSPKRLIFYSRILRSWALVLITTLRYYSKSLLIIQCIFTIVKKFPTLSKFGVMSWRRSASMLGGKCQWKIWNKSGNYLQQITDVWGRIR
jgi:hypothetical protein